MSYPAYVDNGGIANGTGGAVNVPYPATVNADDILIMQVLCAYTDVVATPSGWTLITYAAANTEASVAWFYKRAAGTESGNVAVSVTFSTPATYMYGVISRFSGCVTSGVPYESMAFDGVYSDSTYAVPTVISPLGIERLAVAFPCVEDNVTIDPPASWSEAFEVQDASGDGCSLAAEYIQMPSAASILATTGVLGGTDHRACMVLALIPAAHDTLITDADASITFTTDAEAIEAKMVTEANADITITTDAEIGQTQMINEANADIVFTTDAEVLDPWLEEINCISEIQTEINAISKIK